jgi:glycosyltransferase involved in cell wall biosynthesis
MKPPRLLLVTHYYPEHGGGIELVAGALAGRLAKRGIAIEWAASADTSHRGKDGVVRLTMRAWNWTERRLGVPYPVWGPMDLLRLARAVHRCDAVHLHDCLYAGNVAAYLLAGLAAKPVIVTQHIGLVPYKSAVLRGMMAVANRVLGRLVLRGADKVVFISAAVQTYFERLYRFRRPPAFIANGVDTARFQPLSDADRRAIRARLGWPLDRPVLLFVGRFVEKKGLTLLRQLAAAVPECTWVFVGAGPIDPTSWGLPNVRCLGLRPPDEVAACHQAADLLVLPSVGEGFPLVVQEAMACGTPALITDDTAEGYPPVRNLVYTAPPDASALERQVRAALADPNPTAKRSSVAAFAHEHWDWERCADRYEALLRGLTTNDTK